MKLYRIPILLVFLAGQGIAQTTWYVDGVNGNDSNNGQSPATAFQHISFGVSSTIPGDTVMVAPGVYSPAMGELFPIGPLYGIAVIGSDPRTTIIDADAANQGYRGDVVQIHSDSYLGGFTVRNAPHGSVNWWSGAIHIDDYNGGVQVSNVTVERCILDTINRAFYVGNPWDCIIDHVILRNNFIVRCSSDAIGFFADRSSTLSVGNAVHNNTILGGDPNHTIRTALWFEKGITADIRNNILIDYTFNAVGIAGQGTNVFEVHYNNCVGLGNSVWVDPGNPSANPPIPPTIATVNETNTTSYAPMVVDLQGDPHLLHGSPCIDAGDPTMTTTDDIDGNGLDGGAIDQGCDEKLVSYLESEFYAWPTVEGNASTTFTYLGEPNHGAVLFTAVGLSAAGPLNLGAMGFLNLDPLTMFPFSAPVTLDASGLSQVSLPVAVDPYLMGPTIYLQSLNFNQTLTQMGLSDLEEIAYGR